MTKDELLESIAKVVVAFEDSHDKRLIVSLNLSITNSNGDDAGKYSFDGEKMTAGLDRSMELVAAMWYSF